MTKLNLLYYETSDIALFKTTDTFILHVTLVFKNTIHGLAKPMIQNYTL